MRLTGTEVNAMLYSNRRKGNRPEINPRATPRDLSEKVE